MRNPRTIKVDQSMIQAHALSTESPPENSLFWQMWNANIQIAQQALSTPFVQGIKAGTLDPVTYGAFCISDVYYCFEGADDYSAVAEGATSRTLKAFLVKKAMSYHAYNDSFTKTWHVRDASGVVPTDVTKAYSSFESQVAKDQPPIYTLVAMLPCEYLWAWLGQELADDATDDNLYKNWITGNQGFKGSYTMGNFLMAYAEENPAALDNELAMDIYTQAITYEWKNFLAATETGQS